MMPLPDNEDIVCYFVTKHSWKGKYKRIFSVGTTGITTYKPQTLEVTNRWLYNDVFALKISSSPHEFLLEFRKEGSKRDTMRFSTEHRSQLLSEAFKSRHIYHERWSDTKKYEAFKQHWSGTRLPVLLEVTPISVDQLDTATTQVLASYCFKDIQCVQLVTDVPQAFVLTSRGFGRKHLFISQNRDEVIKKIQENATHFLAISVEVATEEITLEEFTNKRFGAYSDDEFVTSVVEFTVEKIQNNRHTDAEKRLMCLSQMCLVERDKQTYNAVTLRPLSDITALIRCDDNSQLFTIEYAEGSSRTYLAVNRDSLLATLMDAVRGSGNIDVHVKMKATARGKRVGPFYVPMEQEVESIHIQYLKEASGRKKFCEMLERFNTNVPYSGLNHQVSQDGLFTDNKEKMIQQALLAIIGRELEPQDMDPVDVEAMFHTLRRLIASKAGFAAFTALQGFREALGLTVVKALKRNHEAITHAAIDMLCALMKPMHGGESDLRQEQLNKSSLLATPQFLQTMLDMWITHVERGTGTLVVMAMLDFLTFALCVPFSETTESRHFDTLLEMVAKKGRTLFKLFQHTSLAVVKGAGLVMRAVVEEGETTVSSKMQELALCEGALPRHLLIALFTKGSEQRLLAHRQLSRHLVGLWVCSNTQALELLRRCMPSGLLEYLDSKESVPDGEAEDVLQMRDNLKLALDHAAKSQPNHISAALGRHRRILEKHMDNVLEHWGTSLSQTLGIERKDEKTKERPIVLRMRRERIKSEANWKLFYYMFNHDHKLANLIWNHKTREELREALEAEVRLFSSDQNLPGNTLIAWNHSEFEVNYRSLSEEVCINGYYLNLLLEQNLPDSLTKDAQSFFNNLYHRFLINPKMEMKCTCLQAMTVVYGRYHNDIGPFADTKYIVGMLERCMDRTERDRLVLFMDKLILHKQNVKAVIDVNGVQTLVDLLTLAHLHTSRAVVPTQTNVIEAGHEMTQDNQQEWWYYSEGPVKEKKGPVTFEELRKLWVSGEVTVKTKCWAQGLDSWRLPQNIPQLKWTLMARNSPVMNETELATTILNMLIKMCHFYPSRDGDGAVIWPIPRVKRDVTTTQCLPHVVQLLLTFDPGLVEKVATLLSMVAEQNSQAASLYTSGVFYFILMYTGSNVLPIARFLQLTHTRQAFRADQVNSSELMQRSVLGQLLPEAMVYYLENHGANKFAQTFLGEYDNPEAIWSSEMRRMLIEKIALHLADFTPRLRGNNRATYSYIAIPAVRYPQLAHELFCNIFYLRHLCDISRFPDWPINEPVKLLKDVLELWRVEVEKKPPEMSVDDAYEVLGLERGQHHEDSVIRKTYLKLAQIYHPDKNPQGKETFQKMNKAHDFLCCHRHAGGPNPDNIVLILQTQSILFQRYSRELQPYKYAGYSQLIKTIQLETADSQLFSKTAPLLVAATELAHHTIHCSVLNAEELNREGGFQELLAALSRCVSVLSRSSKQQDMTVAVCTHCIRCFSAAAQFPACRDTFVLLPQLITDLVRILHFKKNLVKLCCEVVDCIQNLALDARLQGALLNSGLLWYLLTFLFSYDFTLEECGVERTEDSNNQEVLNRLAKLSVGACARLAGYAVNSVDNPTVKKVLVRLLTPYLADLLAEDQPNEFLKLLTSNSENPYLLWDNSTRAELQDLLDKLCDLRQPPSLADLHFSYSSHATELLIGSVFIRLYNAQPTFSIKNPKGFFLDLLEYVRLHQPSLSGDEPCDPERNERVTMALQALSNVINNNPGLEMQCIGHMKQLFSLLSLDSCRNIQQATLSVITSVTRNQECISDIAASNVLVYLLLGLYTMPDSRVVIVNILHALVSNSSIVKDFYAKGGYIYLLDMLLSTSTGGVGDSQLEVQCADLLGRLCADKLSGPRVRLALDHFLPPALGDALRDSPAQCPTLLHTNQSNPELVWDDSHRHTVATAVSSLARRHLEAHRQSHSAVLTLPDKNVLCGDSKDVVVGGVYLHLFNKNPGWTLRRPCDFLSSLLDVSIKQLNKDTPDYTLVELVVTSLKNLLQCHPTLADQVPSLGFIPRLCDLMRTQPSHQLRASRALLTILHQLSISDICITNMGLADVLKPIQTTMKDNLELVVLGCDTLARLFLAQKEPLVKQALDVDTVPFLLALLDGPLDRMGQGGSSKALVVKALKAMSQSALYGPQVLAILNKFPVWANYSQQIHDLFISNTPQQAYLQGAPVTAGYLTQGSSQPLPNSPPPLDPDTS